MACNKLRDWDTTLFRVSAGKEGRWAVPTGLRKALFVGFYAPKFYWFWGKMKYFDFIFSLTYFWWVRVNAMLKEVLPKFLLPQVLTKSWRFPVPWLNLPMSALEQWKRGDSKNGYDHQYSLYDSGKANSILKKRKSPGAAEFDEIIFKTFFFVLPRTTTFLCRSWMSFHTSMAYKLTSAIPPCLRNWKNFETSFDRRSRRSSKLWKEPKIYER